MSRLIDADELKEVLDGYYYPEYGKPNFDLDFLLNEVIDKQPTAYNLDKVVRELEETKEKAYELRGHPHMDYGTLCGWISATDKAIEIVKRGGVDESDTDK